MKLISNYLKTAFRTLRKNKTYAFINVEMICTLWALMLSKDFLKLVLLASLIAFPLAWWAMNTWLNDFAYRITT